MHGAADVERGAGKRRGFDRGNIMVTVMDDRARAIMDQARETLHRVRDVKVEHRSDHDDALTGWRRGMPPAERSVTLDDVDARIAEEREISDELHGRLLSSERRRHREALAAEIAKLEQRHHSEMRELREVLRDLLRSTDALERSFSRGGAEVIDLPVLPLRGQRRG